MIRLFKEIPQFDFLSQTKWFVSLSAIFIIVSIGSLLVKGLNLGLDFRGGTEVQIKFEQSPDKDQLRLLLEPVYDSKVSIVDVEGLAQNELLISFSNINLNNVAQDVNQLTRQALDSSGYEYEIRQLGTIGPKIGSELKKNAWYSVLISLILVLAYMGFRFNFQFGVGSIAALVHDALITVGAFSLFNIEFDLTALAGILTLIGYSLNDSIVIFDRVRENIARHPGEELKKLINLSVNETLSRTILTVTTTFIIILAMFIWGGSSIRGFSFSFLIGIIAGTYSSVFIASPVAIAIAKRRQQEMAEATSS